LEITDCGVDGEGQLAEAKQAVKAKSKAEIKGFECPKSTIVTPESSIDNDVLQTDVSMEYTRTVAWTPMSREPIS